MIIHDIAEFGEGFEDVNPCKRTSVEDACDAVALAKSKKDAMGRYMVVLERYPRIEITFGPGNYFDEMPFDSVYGAGAAYRAVQTAIEDYVQVNIANHNCKALGEEYR